MSVIEQ